MDLPALNLSLLCIGLLVLGYSTYPKDLNAKIPGSQHELFLSVAGEDQLLTKEEYFKWASQTDAKWNRDSLIKYFVEADLNSDETISISEFQKKASIFNRNKLDTMEIQIPFMWLFTTTMIIILFFTFATHIFLRKMKELNSLD